MWQKHDDFVDFDDSNIDWCDILEEPGDHGSAGADEKSQAVESLLTPMTTGSTSSSTRRSKKLNFVYVCPFCEKKYKSASGFRGHVKSVHNQDIKASSYKCKVGETEEVNPIRQEATKHNYDTGKQQPTNTSGGSEPATALLSPKKGFYQPNRKITITHLEDNMQIYILNVLEHVASDKNVNFDGSIHGQKVSTLAGIIAEALHKNGSLDGNILLELAHQIWKAITSGDVMKVYSSHNEEVWHTFFNLWINETTTKRLSDNFKIICNDSAEQESIFLLTRMVLFKLMAEVRLTCNAEHNAATPKSTTEMLAEEREALRYFAGYVPYKLLKKLQQKKSDQSGLINLLNKMKEDEQQRNGGSMANTKQWLHQQDQGGLFHVNDSTFLFFQEVEIVCKKHLRIAEINDGKNIHELIFKDIQSNRKIQSLWSCITRSADNDEMSSSLATMIVELYVQVRCFSFCKSIVELFKTSRNKHVKGSKGLRKTLR